MYCPLTVWAVGLPHVQYSWGSTPDPDHDTDHDPDHDTENEIIFLPYQIRTNVRSDYHVYMCKKFNQL